MTGIVEGLGGKVTKTENWGVRSLTYRMNKNRKAHFVLMNLDAPSARSPRSSGRSGSPKTSSATSPSAWKSTRKVPRR